MLMTITRSNNGRLPRPSGNGENQLKKTKDIDGGYLPSFVFPFVFFQLTALGGTVIFSAGSVLCYGKQC